MMIYGSGDFAGCPWEIVIKEFRSFCRGRKFSKLSDCVSCFREFISQERWREEETEALSNAHLLVSQIEFILDGLEFDDDEDFRKIVNAEADLLRDHIESKEIILNALTLSSFVDEFGEQIKLFIGELTNRKVSKSTLKSVSKYLFEFYRRGHCESGYETGVVFLGYGNDQIYPEVQEWIYDGRLRDMLRFWPRRQMNLNESDSPTGVVMAFAQRDMAHLFMEGVSPNYVAFFLEVLKGLIAQKSEQVLERTPAGEKLVESALQEKENELIMSNVMSAFLAMKQMQVINPLMEAIRALPREEMMAMAEAFVELTSMRRKVDSRLQTVGGPVDVAFLSKGDGFVWGKRKLYFNSELNADYFKRRANRLV